MESWGSCFTCFCCYRCSSPICWVICCHGSAPRSSSFIQMPNTQPCTTVQSPISHLMRCQVNNGSTVAVSHHVYLSVLVLWLTSEAALAATHHPPVLSMQNWQLCSKCADVYFLCHFHLVCIRCDLYGLGTARYPTMHFIWASDRSNTVRTHKSVLPSLVLMKTAPVLLQKVHFLHPWW